MSACDTRLRIAPALAILFWLGGASAQTMTDPTRPPRAAVAEDGAGEPGRAAVLQSIIIAPHGRSAIINGERVELGGTYGDARVLKISETEVVLRSAASTEILKLYPNVDKALKRTGPPQTSPKAARNGSGSR